MLSWEEIISRAVIFQKNWKNNSGIERQEGQTFEKDFMSIFGVDFREGFHEYQVTLNDGSLGYIDYLLPGKILIEMKSKGKSLAKAYSQAREYIKALKPEEQPSLVMVCDFKNIEIYNLNKDIKYKPFKVSQLKQYVRIFGVLAGYKDKHEDKNEIELNTKASYKMAKLHDQLKEYGYDQHALEIYLVRLLFCLFAEDTGIFEKYTFENYIKSSKDDGSDLSMKIMFFFSILDTPIEKRMTNLSDNLKNIRYINGKLFSDTLPPAIFDEKMRHLLLECCKFDWSKISPAIFGAMFQGVIAPEQRRELGIHYTSEENIMKLIKPLFLDELYIEFEHSKATEKELENFHDKISKLKFLDPACGSGNFLILAYQKLRELEFELLKYLKETKQLSLFDINSKVHINQFFGIEYEASACEIAKISILLMKHLLDQKVSNYFGKNIIDFPIKENVNIIHGNALRLNWEDITQEGVDYMLGNPPFIGKKYMSKDQKEDLKSLFPKKIKVGDLDYVTGWFYKASLIAKNNCNTKIAFVSTNSICQGEQVAILWKPILNENNCKIDFAYRTFKWENEAKGKAAVYCIIVGFSNMKNSGKNKSLFLENGELVISTNINGYLSNADDIFINSETSHIQNRIKMIAGNKPCDYNNLKIEKEEYLDLIEKCPSSKKWIKKMVGAKEFLHSQERYCLWLVDCGISELKSMPLVVEKVKRCREARIAAGTQESLKLAETPTIFREQHNPENYLLIPAVSSEKREYIPIGYLDKDTVPVMGTLIIPNADIIDFSFLTSSAHMAWVRAICGRLESRYRYSKNIVYNNFPFPELDEKIKEKLEKTAQKILEVRKKYPNDSYADLYEPSFMPSDLRRAHQENDKAVWEAYGKKWELGNESECLAYLIKFYQDLLKNKGIE
ncbi:class I SAM-dependent DNA methyltransferase [Cetobacterium sp.]|uniref:class I SAM-dependent DNA methyltransferase n=1 Tax=Cetobacterium sp. TaxID=2071632 RepID=UPI003F334E0D